MLGPESLRFHFITEKCCQMTGNFSCRLNLWFWGMMMVLMWLSCELEQEVNLKTFSKAIKNLPYLPDDLNLKVQPAAIKNSNDMNISGPLKR